MLHVFGLKSSISPQIIDCYRFKSDVALRQFIRTIIVYSPLIYSLFTFSYFIVMTASQLLLKGFNQNVNRIYRQLTHSSQSLNSIIPRIFSCLKNVFVKGRVFSTHLSFQMVRFLPMDCTTFYTQNAFVKSNILFPSLSAL